VICDAHGSLTRSAQKVGPNSAGLPENVGCVMIFGCCRWCEWSVGEVDDIPNMKSFQTLVSSQPAITYHLNVGIN
jgi:hypothetical protein